MGTSVTAGMSPFCFDPFELYPTIVSNPSVLVTGAVGAGKSTVVKSFIRRSLAVYGARRFVVVLDPKGEYRPLADDLGIPVLTLHPGGTSRLNPMDPSPDGDPTDVLARQSLAAALVAGVLGRDLDPAEDALLGWAIQSLANTGQPFTLADLVDHVRHPSDDLVALSGRTALDLAHAASPVLFSLDKLCGRTLRGMFDGPTTVGTTWLQGPGLVIDLSAVYQDRTALPLVLLAATTWLTSIVSRRWDRRTFQVVDEAWAAIGAGHRHLQASLKLARSSGVSTWLLCHRPADLTAQADDGTSAAKIAAGLLSDIDTRIIGRQPPDQIEAATELFGLTTGEADLLPHLPRGRALWRFPRHSCVVHGHLTPAEQAIFDTDAGMTA